MTSGDELDELDELAAKLFAAARAETPSVEVQQRALDAGQTEAARLRSASRARFAYALFGAAAGIAVLVGATWRGGRIDTILNAEPIPIATAPSPTQDVKGIASAEAPAKEIAPDTVAEAARLRKARPSSLSEEIASLDAVRDALAAGDPSRALGLLDRHRGSRLTDEATVLRIEALYGAGRAAAASELARGFVENNPTSPLTDRVRRFALRVGADGGAP